MSVTGRRDAPLMTSNELPTRPPVRTWQLRALLTLTIHAAGRPVTVAELVDAVEATGFGLAGRSSKVVSDAVRGDVAKGWVRRVGRGRYAPGYLPRSSKTRLRGRVEQALRESQERSWAHDPGPGRRRDGFDGESASRAVAPPSCRSEAERWGCADGW